MALPKVNVLPKFELTIPSTQKKAFFRPYLVKEEKVLLLALESEDVGQIIDAISRTITECSEGGLDMSLLTTFDIEYIFTKVRAKSVGEIVRMKFQCNNEIEEDGKLRKCNHVTEVPINIDKVEVDVPKMEKVVKLSDNISVELQWPPYQSILHDINTITEDAPIETLFTLASKCIAAVLTVDERLDVRDETEEEIVSFIESLSSQQFEKITAFLNKMPKLKYETEYDCDACGTKHTLKLEGMTDFF